MVPATVQDLKRMGISVLMKQLIRRHLFQTALVIAKVVCVRWYMVAAFLLKTRFLCSYEWIQFGLNR
jgi:hypothetical protein